MLGRVRGIRDGSGPWPVAVELRRYELALELAALSILAAEVSPVRTCELNSRGELALQGHPILEP
jgi:hypothetical protein